MSDTQDSGYQVLARKYRPETFADLVGQDAMVRTLKNAFEADRIAQAFIMTGIRGTRKTTTARIIAKGMNCIGPDGEGGPTTDPCGECEHCKAIMEGRHVDVLEMDAASNTGVGNIREIIESVHYRAASARYKVYIIDEVHMLSTGAFNALLKTLEEPPAHVKFIFATTEIRKVPVTVLSRCQRFDLRRIEPEVMLDLLRRIAGNENAQIAEDALALITRAAEGSARDATSLLDQAISHGAGETTAEQVRAMLGLADRGRVMDLFDLVMKGDAAGALTELSSQYAEGADPMAVLRDLAEVTHWVSVVKITPEAAEDPTIGPDERTRGGQMAEALPMRVLTRMWQMLLKALEEVAAAPNSMMAAEMAIIRLTHVADLPSPEDLVRRLRDNPPSGPPNGPAPTPPSGGKRRRNPWRTRVPVRRICPDANHRWRQRWRRHCAGDAGRGLPRALPHLRPRGRTHPRPSRRQAAGRGRDLAAPRRLPTGPHRIRPHGKRPPRSRGPSRHPPADLDRQPLGRHGRERRRGRDHRRGPRRRPQRARGPRPANTPWCKPSSPPSPRPASTISATPEDIAAEAQADALPEVDDEWDPFEED